MSEDEQRILIILGPTAAGKTGLGIDLARRFGGEIVSADSMQVYRGMDIGTATPTSEEMAGVPHHLVNIIPPTESFSAGRFKRLAREAICDVAARGCLPIVVGGTALYIRVLLYDFPLAAVPADHALRERLGRVVEKQGSEVLHGQLEAVDPDSAERIHPNDARRIIRALEVHAGTGATMTEWRNSTPREPVFDALKIGLRMDREVLYDRIDRRVDRMIEEGLVDEVRSLLERYGGLSRTASRALGYREAASYLGGEMGLEECIENIKKNTRNFAKRQLTWFRKDPDIRWIGAARDGTERRAAELVEEWMLSQVP